MTVKDLQPTVSVHAFLAMALTAVVTVVALGEPLLFAKSGSRTIQIEFFWAKDCPHCESAKTLVSELQKSHPIKVREFDIEKEADYAAFHSVQAIHKRSNLSVPLIVVGKDLLVGESEIKAHLEGRIQTLIGSSNKESQKKGSAKKAVTESNSPPSPTKDKAKPAQDSVREEWGKMKMTIDEFF